MVKTSKKDVWKPRYGNDSRPWLVSAGDCARHVTTMSEEFLPQSAKTIRSTEGIRKKLLRNFFWQEISEKMFNELTADNTELDTDESEYKDNFQVEGHDGKPAKYDPELHKKYPLYMDVPRTVWYDKFSSLPGATLPPTKRPQDVFRRTTPITKAIDEI